VPRLEPPPDLGVLEREIWLQTVAATPSEFEPEDRELLRAYCVAAAQFRRATTSVAAGDMKALKVQAAAPRSWRGCRRG
jgi:phage terminase small subunit